MWIRVCLKGGVRSSRVHADWAERDPRTRILGDRAPVDTMAPSSDRCHHRSTVSR